MANVAIGSKPELTTIVGTESIPITGSKHLVLNTLRAWTDESVPSWSGTKPTTDVVHRVFAPGDTTDMAATIQAALDALPATGGAVVVYGKAQVNSSITEPANSASATGEATFILAADTYGEIVAGGAQDFHIIDWSGYGVAQKLNFEFRNLRVTGLWESTADGAGKSNSSYRGIKADYANRVSVINCKVDNVRGMSISIDKCTEGVVTGCTVTRSGKDGISVTNCLVSTVHSNTVFGCGDNTIAVHAGVLTTGTIANSNGTIQTTSGSPTVTIQFEASNGAIVGDRLVITGEGTVGGLNMKGTWPIVTKADGTHCTFTHDYNATSTVGSGTPPGATFAYEIGVGGDDRRQMITVTDNRVENGFGIKVLGGPNAVIANNNIKLVHGTGIHVGGEGAGGEGMIPYRSLDITGNIITDVIKKSYLGMNAPYDACILVDHRWFTVGQARIEGNILNNNRPKGSTTTPSQWLRGYYSSFGGPTPNYQWFSADGYVNTAFSGEPTYQTQTGIQINCKNAGDRSAIRVARNTFSGMASNQQVRRYIPLNQVRITPTITTTSPTKASLEAAIAAITVDLAPAYSAGLKVRIGSPTNTGSVFEARFRKNDGIGIDALVETTWESGTSFATAAVTTDGTANKDYTTAMTALPTDAKRSMDIVIYGYSGASTLFELIECALIVDHADNDSDYVAPVAQSIYDPTAIFSGAFKGFGIVANGTLSGLDPTETAGRIIFEEPA